MSRIVSPLLVLLLLGGGLWGVCPPEGKAQAPPSVERVRERIQVLRGGPTGAPAVEGERRAQVVDSLPARRPLRQTTGEGLTRRDLRQFEERLLRRMRDVVRRQIALTQGERRERGATSSSDPYYPPSASAPTVVQYYTPGAPPDPTTPEGAPPDTTRRPLPPSVDTTVRPVAPPPDTVVQRRMVQVRRSLLETGLFRAFEVNFAFGESELLPRAQRSLDAVGEVLQQYPALRLEVAGHTDAIGSEEFNQQLSQERAAAVREYLVDKFALSPDRLEVRGYGESRPIASNGTSVGRELNRRVEFVVLNPEEAERILDVTETTAPE